MTRQIAVTAEQLQRPQPGGIGTYVRGLLTGLNTLRDRGEDLAVTTMVAHGENPADGLAPSAASPFGERVTTALWRRWPLAVPPRADVVHATTVAGPFCGGSRDAVHSVLVHDVLWRDHPELTTPRGARFHERRLQLLVKSPALRVIVTSPPLRDRLLHEGVDASRLFVVRLGLAPALHPAPSLPDVLVEAGFPADELQSGNFTLAVGTREPRKNLERLIAAQLRAQQNAPELGPLVVVGAEGWGDVDTTGATVLGALSDPARAALLAHCRVAAYVPIEEGWGLPAVEALAAGRPVVASETVPSVRGNAEVGLVDPLDVAGMSRALVEAAHQPDEEQDRERRRATVAELTWENCALDHLRAWS